MRGRKPKTETRLSKWLTSIFRGYAWLSHELGEKGIKVTPASLSRYGSGALGIHKATAEAIAGISAGSMKLEDWPKISTGHKGRAPKPLVTGKEFYAIIEPNLTRLSTLIKGSEARSEISWWRFLHVFMRESVEGQPPRKARTVKAKKPAKK